MTRTAVPPPHRTNFRSHIHNGRRRVLEHGLGSKPGLTVGTSRHKHGPPSRAGDVALAPYPASGRSTARSLPKARAARHSVHVARCESQSDRRTTILRTFMRLDSSHPGFLGVFVNESTRAELLPVVADAQLKSRDARRGSRRHFTSADDTTCADEGSDDPKPHSASPSIPSPRSSATPHAHARRRACKRIAQRSHHRRFGGTPCLARADHPALVAHRAEGHHAGSWGGERNMTSTHPMHRSKAIIDPGAESSGSWPMQSLSPPT